MADASDPTSGGEAAFAYLQTTHIPSIVEGLIRAQRIALDHEELVLRDQVAGILSALLEDVNRAAVQMAGVADGLIVAKMFETHSANRPLQGNMESHVRSEPGPLGSVRVALISELDKIINPNGYYPFWRAQEYGTGVAEGGYGGGGIPEQAGRPLYGTFEPSGEPPRAAQRGLGAGHDLAFNPSGTPPGFGRISVELPGRHFLRDGTTEAGARYLKRMEEIQEKYLGQLRKLSTNARRRAQGGRRFIGRIEA